MRLSISFCVRLSIGLSVVCLPAPLWGEEPRAEAGSVLRIARSNDGLRFTTDAEAFVVGGSSPGVATLESGELMAVFDAPGKASDGRTMPSVRRSKDDGRTWSPVEAVEMDDAALRGRAARGGELVVEERGGLRLYFSAVAPPNAKGKSKWPPVIRSATSKDGRSFKPDSTVAFRCRGMAEPRACVVRDGERRVMLIADELAAVPKGDDPFVMVRAVSRDGRTFASTAPVQLASNIRITSVVAVDKGYRGYGWSDDGIVSLRSDDLKEWEVDKGTRLTEAWDPAVVRLKNGTYLMIYNAGARAPQPEPAVADAAEGDAVDLALVDGFEGELEDDEPDVNGLAPQPDFAQPVDYAKWYRENAIEPTDDNAYDAYAAFLPKFDSNGVADRDNWPEFKDMYNGQTESLPIQPWKPEDHPDWEETHRNAKDVLAKFREANLRSGYAPRLDPSPDASPDGPDVDRLLVSTLFPALSPYRTLSKATLAEGWRTESNGKPSADWMIDSWKTVLRGAEHMDSGTTLIESLVGMASGSLTEINARWALKHRVFDEKQLEQAFDALRQYDGERRDPGKWIRGEHAAALDMTQFAFSPPGPDGQPAINLERIKRLSSTIGDSPGIEEFEHLGPHDAHATIEAFNRYFREALDQLRVGYPDVKSKDLEATESRYLGGSPLTKLMMPSLSRYHALRTRGEASRRATQLSYAVHIHHARTGQWPKSLEELPSEFGSEIRTDPYTGRSFGYRADKNGPTIYSASENGVDDGGLHSFRWGDWAENGASSDDFVFWPPQE